MKARSSAIFPHDQETLAHPRIGFFGVIDERFDIGLLEQLSILKPAWQFIIVGPVVKIDPAILPQAPNIYYSGPRSYEELPNYLSGWDVALIPFALNDSTQFISPTKTPEYLAGGIPVVSSGIRDVITPYGEMGLVYIANNVTEFITGIEWGLTMRNNSEWLDKVDRFLAGLSWDNTFEQMETHVRTKMATKQNANLTENRTEYV